MEFQDTNLERVTSAIKRFERPLIRYAAALTGDADRARDIVQDTFLRLWQQHPESMSGGLAEWLFTVCRRRALDIWRKESRLVALNDEQIQDQCDEKRNPAAEAEHTEAHGNLRRHVSTLPRNQQEVLRLRFQSGLSYAEISKVTGLSPTNVGFLLHTAIATLRKELRPKEET